MKYYLDFEATQFSAYVISIGCVSENGDTFYSLVQPPKKKKLTPFIVSLTGITDEMLESAPPTEVAFTQLQEFIRDTNRESGGEETFFYCYGDMDPIFVIRSMNKITTDSPYYGITDFMTNLANSMIDYTKYVSDFFGVQQVALQKVVSYFRGEDTPQSHNALDDAGWLAEIANHISHDTRPENSPWPNKEKVVHNQTFMATAQKSKKRPYIITATSAGGGVKKFPNMKQARQWIWDYKMPANNKKTTTIEKCGNRLHAAMEAGRTYCGYTWKRFYLDEKEEVNNE